MSLIASLITSEDCADCRLCCWFTRYDLWETPVIDTDLRKIISERYTETKFISREVGGMDEVIGSTESGSLFIMTESPQTDPKYEYQPERFNCPMLTESGCCLGDDKPFECQIWPYRIMSQGDKLLISLSLLCKPICEKSLASIVTLLKNGLAEKIIAYAKLHPCIIKEYTDGYPILMYIK